MALKKKGTTSKKRRTITVDMEGVESGGKIVKDGTYHARLEELTEKESKAENPMLEAKWKILSGSAKGALVYDNISLTPQALWRLKGLCEALEIEVPDGSMDIDLDDLIGQECSIQITNETFEGRDRPKVSAYGSVGEEDEEEESEDDEEEEEDERVGKKPKKKPSKDEDEEEESDDEDEEESDDEDDEDDEEEEEDEKPKAKKKTTSSSKKSKFKEGQKVSFKDDKGKTVRGIVLEIDDETVKVEDKGGDEWEIDVSELTAL